jgi:ATP phosphoribosyltransferase
MESPTEPEHEYDPKDRSPLLPALQKPTVSALSDPDWVDVITIADESVVRSIVPKLRGAGAQGIVEYPINKIIE